MNEFTTPRFPIEFSPRDSSYKLFIIEDFFSVWIEIEKQTEQNETKNIKTGSHKNKLGKLGKGQGQA